MPEEPAVAVSPTPAEIRAARESLGLTQAKAAELAYLGAATRWAEYESGARKIDRARWALFRLRSRLVTLKELGRE